MTATRAPATGELMAHAAALGVEAGYWDVGGTWHDAGVSSVLAVLEALGAPIDAGEACRSAAGLAYAVAALGHHVDMVASAPIDPVVCVVGATSAGFELRLAADDPGGRVAVDLELEQGGRLRAEHLVDSLEVVGVAEIDGRRIVRRAIPVPSEPGGCDGSALPVGYHELTVEHGEQAHRATVLIAPDHVHQLGDRDRLWGVFAPVYALRRPGDVGPDLGCLAQVASWIDGHGGKIVATLPMLSSYLDRPCEPSPYSPVSRRFWNEIYLDLERLPEMAESPRARELLERIDSGRDHLSRGAAPNFDAVAQSRIVDRVLTELARSFFERSAAGAAGFDRWVNEHPLATDYARFRAVVERQGAGWRDWPDRLRQGPIREDDYDVRVAARHVYAQWSMDRQLAELSAGLSSRGQLLYLDLPIGAGPDGFDTWIDRDAYAWGAAVGAPPDEFFAAGQNWGFPPLRPAAGRAEGHRHLAECLRHHMTHAGMLRLDHVMGMHRLFFVPEGMAATDGVYVRYPADEQFAVVAIESVRAGCAVVGEDLGTVPTEVRDAMDRHRVLRSFVAEFSMPGAPGDDFAGPDHRSVASVDTHDTPTFAAFLQEADIIARHDEGRLSDDEAERAIATRRLACDALSAVVAARGIDDVRPAGTAPVLLGGLLTLLGHSDAPAVLVGLDDLLGETEPQNVPGTGPDRPNWVLRLPLDLDELADDPSVAALLDRLQGSRLASHARAS
jgi:4-alpha-glucanotransferase